MSEEAGKAVEVEARTEDVDPTCVSGRSRDLSAGHEFVSRSGIGFGVILRCRSSSALSLARSPSPRKPSPNRALCLPTFSHFLIVNKASLSLSLSLSPFTQNPLPPRPLVCGGQTHQQRRMPVSKAAKQEEPMLSVACWNETNPTPLLGMTLSKTLPSLPDDALEPTLLNFIADDLFPPFSLSLSLSLSGRGILWFSPYF